MAVQVVNAGIKKDPRHKTFSEAFASRANLTIHEVHKIILDIASA